MASKLRALATRVLETNEDLTLATLRADGWPQATIVGFVHDGLTIYFGIGRDSQKHRNLAHDARVSIACGGMVGDWSKIQGISLAGRAHFVVEEAEKAKVGTLMMARFGDRLAALTSAGQLTDPPEMTLVRIDPVLISVLDYTKGFGHTDLLVI